MDLVALCCSQTGHKWTCVMILWDTYWTGIWDLAWVQLQLFEQVCTIVGWKNVVQHQQELLCSDSWRFGLLFLQCFIDECLLELFAFCTVSWFNLVTLYLLCCLGCATMGCIFCLVWYDVSTLGKLWCLIFLFCFSLVLHQCSCCLFLQLRSGTIFRWSIGKEICLFGQWFFSPLCPMFWCEYLHYAFGVCWFRQHWR